MDPSSTSSSSYSDINSASASTPLLTSSPSRSSSRSSSPIVLRNSRGNSHLTQSAPLPDPTAITRVASAALVQIVEAEEYQPLPRIKVESSSPSQRRDGKKELKISILQVVYPIGEAAVSPPSSSVSKKNRKSSIEQIEEIGVSQEFIEKYNKTVFSPAKHNKAERLSKCMRQLAGLDPSENPPDISDARIGLCMLAKLKNEKLKMEALNSLEELLTKDEATPETAINLITFASNFFNLITRKEFKEESPPTQEKIEAIFDLLLPLLQKQFEQKQIKSISSELRSELNSAAIELGKLKVLTNFTRREYAVDVPTARLELCRNASDTDDKAKKEALDALEYIIKNDPCIPDTAPHLIDLAINYLTLINKEEFQKELPGVQIQMVIIYDALIELLQRQYMKGEIGAITENLKREFVAASKALGNLNTHDNRVFKYHIRCALQGSRNLKDDRKKLYDYLNRAFKVGSGIVSVGVQEVDAGTTKIAEALSSIDIRIKHTWYENTLILKNLGREAFSDHHKLVDALSFISLKTPKSVKDKMHKEEQRWEFYYTAIELLKNISLGGATPEIRQFAVDGGRELAMKKEKEAAKMRGKQLSKKGDHGVLGLDLLAGVNTLKEYRDLDKIERFEKAIKIDPNIFIRAHAVDSLGVIAASAIDDEVKTLARKILNRRLEVENVDAIKETIKGLLPQRHAVRKKKPRMTT